MENFYPLSGLLEQIARAGGGGSSSSSGDGSGILVLVGYIPTYYFTKLVKKLPSRKAAMAVSLVFASIFTIIAAPMGIFGESSTLLIVSIAVIVGIWLGWSTAMFTLWDKMKKKFKKADEDLAKAGWNEAELHEIAANAFLRYQEEWSRRDNSRFAEYMTPHYANHAGFMVAVLAELKRFNVLKDVSIVKMDTVAVVDNADDSQDVFSVMIEAQADDYLMESDGKVLFNDKKPFIEQWSFQRSNDSWLLSSITPSTAFEGAHEQDMRQFATENNMYYSLDMGWLFIPSHGELFNNGKWVFGFSDINNHVIGNYNDRLIQLYTYRRTREAGNSKGSIDFLVGQISVPKEYGGILIERRTGLVGRLFAPKGYQKYEFEWPDFNKRYNVYATDQSRLATFELLNPGFMAFVHDNFNDINIEVIDSSVYFYAEKTGQRNDYQQLMTLLLKAFKELQL